MRPILRWFPRSLAVAALLAPLASFATAASAREPGAELVAAARAAREAGEYARAESLATLARDAIRPRTRADSLHLAAAWCELSSAIARRRRYADTLGTSGARRSLALYERTAATDSLGAAEAHEVLAEFLSMTRHSAEALQHERAALPVLRRVYGAGEPFALALERTALLEGQTGRPDSALAAFESALSIYRTFHYPRNRKVGDTLIGIGLALEAKGEDDLAQDSLDAGLASLEQQMGPTDPALAVGLGRAAGFASRHGEIARLVDLMERAHSIFAANRRSDDPERLVTAAQLAAAYHSLGDHARAVRLFDAALPALSARMGETSHAVMAFTLDQASSLEQFGDTLRAFATLAELERRFERDSTRGDRSVYAQALGVEGQLHESRGDTAAAIARYARARAVLGAAAAEEPGLVARLTRQEMLLHAERGDWRAADSLDDVLARQLPALRGLFEEAGAWAARSRVHLLRGQRDSAFADAHVAARIGREDLARDAAALSDAQALLLAGDRAGALDPLLAAGLGGGAAERRAAWDELARARGLVRPLVARRRLPPSSAGGEWAARHTEWVTAARRLARLEVEMAGEPADSAQRAALTARREEADEAERRLANVAQPGLGPADPARVTLAAVLAALPARGALVGFARAVLADGAAHLVAFVGRAGVAEVATLDLGSASRISALVARWRAELAEERPDRRSEARARLAGEAVRRAVWDPLARSLAGAERVAVVEESPLDGLPWAALPAAGGRYLVESGPRIAVYGAERDLLPHETSRGQGTLVVGGVDFDRPRDDAPASAALRSAPGDCAKEMSALPPLPGTTEEARLVAEALGSRAAPRDAPVTLLLGGAASEGAFKTLAPGRLVVHLATHGVTLSDTCGGGTTGTRGVGGVTALSAPRVGRPGPGSEAAAPRAGERRAPSPWAGRQELLAMAGANHARERARDENDGLLTAAEVGTLDLRGTDWVVLSACHSAAGSAWTLEGVLGLQRAFQLAGARTVIASQWAVEDAATAEWMRALYAARAAGESDAATAMAAADRRVLSDRRRAGLGTHPFYWAAFTASQE